MKCSKIEIRRVRKGKLTVFNVGPLYITPIFLVQVFEFVVHIRLPGDVRRIDILRFTLFIE